MGHGFHSHVRSLEGNMEYFTRLDTDKKCVDGVVNQLTVSKTNVHKYMEVS